MSRLLAATLALGLLAAPAAAAGLPAVDAGAVPEQVPDRVIVASEPQHRGTLTRTPAPASEVSAKLVDGDPGDWVGEPTRIGGQHRLDAGEHVYTDFVLDAWGADDGGDAERLALLDPLREAEPRLDRVDHLQQAAGDQFDAPAPVGVPDHYGDADALVRDPNTVGDLTEVRWAVQDGRALLLVRVNQMRDPAALGVQVNGSSIDDIADAVVRNADGFGGVIEASLPLDVLDGPVSVVAGTTAGGVFVPLNAAYRPSEPVTIYNDRQQALALLASDPPTAVVDAAALASGATESWALAPGYHERQFTSGANISSEDRHEQGQTQAYGLYVPTSYDPTTPTPTTFWLHYRGGKTHSGAAWTPRLITQLGEEHGNLVVSPRARGTSTWYVSEAHQDFFEVFADVHDTVTVDPQRRYVSGYSMGGYGTWLLTTLYPDLFAAGFTQSGAMTQGLWTGVGPDSCPLDTQVCFTEANGGDADAQLTFRALANLRHVPIAIDHGTDDELVPITGIERMAAELTTLGYRHVTTRFHGYEHFTQAIVDEWADGAAYLNRFTAPVTPRHVTYRVVPALVDAVNTVTAETPFDFRPDGAYWVDDIVVADGAASGQVDAVAGSVEADEVLTLPMAGTSSVLTAGPTPAVGPTNQTTTFTRTGLDTLAIGDAPLSRTLTVELTGVASATIDTDAIDLFGDGDAAVLDVTSTGPATLTLLVDGEPRSVAVVAGTQQVALSRA